MLTEIFGESCKRAKVFDLLLSHPYSEYTKKDIAEITGISRGTLDTFIDEIIDYEIIKFTRRIGNGYLYQINMESTITQALNSFQNQLADIEIEKEMALYKEEINPEIEPIKPFEEIVKKTETVHNTWLIQLNSFFNKENEPKKETLDLPTDNDRITYNISETSSKNTLELFNNSPKIGKVVNSMII